MRLHILSDLHLECSAYAIRKDVPCDVIVAAGDIAEGTDGVAFLRTLDRPVIYVLGNHEYYRRGQLVDMDETLHAIRSAAQGSNVHVLENDAVVVEGVRFLGATLWTNFGKSHKGLLEEALHTQNDYRLINAASWYRNEEHLHYFFETGSRYWESEQLEQYAATGRFHPLIALRHHQQSLIWLEQQLDQPVDGHTVVVTHHHPTFEALRQQGLGEEYLSSTALWTRRGLSDDNHRFRVASYASDLSDLLASVRDRVSLWIAGHLHTHLDYLERGIHFVCNPRGVMRASKGSTSSAHSEQNLHRAQINGFDPKYVIDLSQGIAAAIHSRVEPDLAYLMRWHDDISRFSQALSTADPVATQALREAISTRTQRFSELVARVLTWTTANIGSRRPVRDSLQAQFAALGLSGPIGQMHIDPQSYPDFPERELAEQIQIVMQSQGECMRMLEALPQTLSLRQKEAAKRLSSLREALSRCRIPTRLEVPPSITLPWRRLHAYLGAIVVLAEDQDDIYEEIQILMTEALNSDTQASLDFYVNILFEKENLGQQEYAEWP